MRLFVGVEVDDAVKRYIGELSSVLKFKLGRVRASWVKEENYHITLMFIGEVPPSEVDNIDKALSTVVSSPFELTLDRAGSFGSPPKVLWLGVKDSDVLNELAGAVNNVLGGDSSRFHPHITLARIKSRVPRDFHSVVNSIEVKPATWKVERFVLFESQLSPGGSIYTPIKIYDLK